MKIERIEFLGAAPYEWCTRSRGQIAYLANDAGYEHLRQQGAVVTVAALTATGVTPEGNRTVLGLSISDS